MQNLEGSTFNSPDLSHSANAGLLEDLEAPAKNHMNTEQPTIQNKDDFQLVDEATAVSIFNKGTDYVVSANLALGARLDIVSGDITKNGGTSVYGGPNPDLKRMTADQALQKERLKHPEAMIVFNSEFFRNLPGSTAPVAYAFKQDGKVVSEGFATEDRHDGKRLTLAFSGAEANIVPFDNHNIEEFRKRAEPDAVVSLSPAENIDNEAESKIDRTYLGLTDQAKDGNYTRLLVFVSSASTQDHAVETLREFGAGPIIMFDGGGSSQLLCRNNHYVETTRSVPQFLAITPGQASGQKCIPDSSSLR